MIGFLSAHGMDPGPLQRPLSAGGLTGLAAAAPAGAVFAALGSYGVVTGEILRLPATTTVLLLVAACVVSGVLYGLAFRRAANDRRGGWLFGAAFGLLLWIAAPVVVLPLMGGHCMAAGRAAEGFFAGFLVWGAATGALFPYVHRPLQAKLDDGGRSGRRLGPSGAAVASRLLRRTPRWLRR